MSFTDQKQRVATKEDLSKRWGFRASGEGFRCYLCGYRFCEGDFWRWVYAGSRHLMNFFVCTSCDGDDVLDRWKQANNELKERFWWVRH